MPTEMKIATFEAGRPVEGVFAVMRKARRLNRNGDPYLDLELGDDSGTIQARVWEDADHYDRAVRTGDTVRAIGRASRFRDNLQFDVRRIARVDAAEGDTYVPKVRRAIDDLVGELDFLIDEIGDPALHAIVERVWRGSDRDALVASPATAGEHHAKVGGLVEHTISVATLCLAACDRHEYLHRDTVLAAALLHDVGRAREIEVEGTIRSRDDAQLVGHLLLTHEMVMDAVHHTGNAGYPLVPRVVHAIQAHHGPAERCRTPEAHCLRICNTLDVALAR